MKLKRKTANYQVRKLPGPTEENPPGKGANRRIIAVLVVTMIAVGALQVYLSGLIATAGQRIDMLQSRQVELETQNNRLQTRIHQVSSLTQIEERAKNELKMQKRDQAFYYLSPEYLASLAAQ